MAGNGPHTNVHWFVAICELSGGRRWAFPHGRLQTILRFPALGLRTLARGPRPSEPTGFRLTDRGQITSVGLPLGPGMPATAHDSRIGLPPTLKNRAVRYRAQPVRTSCSSCIQNQSSAKYHLPPTALSLEHVLDPRIKDRRAEIRRWMRSTLKSWLDLTRIPSTVQRGSSGINEENKFSSARTPCPAGQQTRGAGQEKGGSPAQTMVAQKYANCGRVSGRMPKLVVGGLASARVSPADALVQAGIPRRPERSIRRPPVTFLVAP
ncbi:hypothetical protein J2T21_004222 [Paeniglutamicibacter psychrophenolicus]|nr:hypothetical protein [Paeniglutamicibacter psychrophenolicus]